MRQRSAKRTTIHPLRDGLGIGIALMVTAGAATGLLYRSAASALRDEVHGDLLRLAHAATSLVDGDLHRTLVSSEQYGSEDYNRILLPLRKFLQATAGVKYLYTAVLREDRICFGVDSALPVDGDGDGVIDQAGLLEVYEDAPPCMLTALQENRDVTTPEPYTDAWGTFITGFVPFYDSSRAQVGVVGIDITATQYEERLAALRTSAAAGAAPAMLLSLLIGAATFWMRRNAARARQREIVAEETLQAAVRRGQSQQAAVAALAISPAVAAGEVEQVARELVELAAKAAGVERVGVWLFRGEGTELRCVDLYEASADRHSSGAILQRHEYGYEFAALEASRYVDAHDSLTDPRTAGYVESYLKPMRIASMLDAVIRVQGRNLGTLCFEHVDRPHRWEQDEIAFACQLGDQVAITIMNQKRGQAEEALRRSQVSLEQSNELLRQASARAEQMASTAQSANQAKNQFLANMSHEIRTPMTAILGFADVLLESGTLENAPPERIDVARTIKRNGEYLLHLIDDILDLSKIESGNMTTERIAYSPCRLVAEVTSLVRVRADSKGLPLRVEYAGPVPETIQTDPTRLRQILINLLGNAVKFTEVGEVRLVVRLVDDDQHAAMQFDVVDVGIGMTLEQVARLFQPFTQADASTTRMFGGTGLGLAISKRLAELLGGDISVVETRPGAGTRMRITVATGSLDGVRMIADPLTASVLTPGEASATASAEQSVLPGCRILLAEDGPDNQRLIMHLLKKAGAEVTVVENGKLAVDAALAALNRRREGDPAHPFDMILMDMQMPVMDGYEATRLLREKGYTGPIVALTAHAMASDRQKCMDAGCDDYASKPINRAKLIETIRLQVCKEPVPVRELKNSVDLLVSGLADDPDLAELVEAFVGELPARVQTIERACAEQDVDALTRLAHQLKGSAGGYGFPAITEAAAKLERDAKARESPDKLTEGVREIIDLCLRAKGRPESGSCPEVRRASPDGESLA